MKSPTCSVTIKSLVATALLVLLSACVLALPKGKGKPLGEAPPAPERTPIYQHDGWTVARATLHNHTIYSDGKRTPEDLLELARRQGMAILAYSDHREGKICIGKGLCLDPGGVERVGYDAYYERLRPLQEKAREQNMIAIKGVEVIPWFYNMGKSPYLVLRGLFQHFCVYGIDDPAVLTNMPIRHNMENAKPEPVQDATHWQEFVDYINDHGGLVNINHPEEPQDEWVGTIHVTNPPPVSNLHRLHGVNSFSVTPEGWHERTGAAGGFWDTDLLEYLAGMRKRPLWALGDADYHGPDGSLAISTTLFYMKEFTEPEVYNCMREGRMVALQGLSFQDTYVAEWWVADGKSPADQVMLGRETRLSGAPIVRFALDHEVPGTRVRLIRNGVVIAEVPGSEITYTDDDLGARREPAFYRVEVVGPVKKREKGEPYVTGEASELFVNPIFVRFGE